MGNPTLIPVTIAGLALEDRMIFRKASLVLATILVLAGFGAHAQLSPITAAPDIGSLQSTDVLPVLRPSNTTISKVTPVEIQAFVQASLLPGCVGNGVTDDSVCAQAAVTAATTAGAPLNLGGYKYAVAGGLTTSGPLSMSCASIQGAGVGGIVETVVNSTLFSSLSLGSSVHGCYIDMSNGGANTNTSGAAFRFNAARVDISGNFINGACNGIDASGSAINVNNNTIGFGGSGCYGIKFGSQTTNGGTLPSYNNNTIVSSLTNRGSADVMIYDAGGPYFTNNDLLFAVVGTYVFPQANQVVEWTFGANTVLGDTTTGTSLLIDTGASSAIVQGFQVDGGWVGAVTGSAHQIVIQNTGGGTVRGIYLNNLRAVGGTQTGAYDNIYVNGAVSNVTILGGNICGVASAGNAIELGAGVSNFTMHHLLASNTCLGRTGYTGAVGVLLDGSNNNLDITWNDLSAFGSSGISGAPGTNSVVQCNNTPGDCPLISGVNTWSATQVFTSSTNEFAAASGGEGIYVAGAAGTARGHYLATGGVAGADFRWYYGANGTAESGGNAGTNYVLCRYPDSGVTQTDCPWAVTRSSGLVSVLDGFRTTPTVFASLPGSPLQGTQAYITDDNSACTYGTTATGSGSTPCKLVYNGTNWVAN